MRGNARIVSFLQQGGTLSGPTLYFKPLNWGFVFSGLTMPSIEDVQAANQQEMDKLHKRHHADRIELEKLTKVNIEQSERIRYLEGGYLDIIEEMKGMINE